MVRDMTGKNFHRYISSKNTGVLLNGVGDLVTMDMERLRCSMCSPKSLLLEFASRNLSPWGKFRSMEDLSLVEEDQAKMMVLEGYGPVAQSSVGA